MENIINNVNLDKINKTIEEGKHDKSSLKKPIKLIGIWKLDPASEFQFKTELNFKRGKQSVEIDSPSFLGGNDVRPGPMMYCISGMASCFIATFATVASLEGIKFSNLQIEAECQVNFSKVLGLGNEPIIEEVNFKIKQKNNQNIDEEKIYDLIRKAKDTCPAIFTLMNTIKVNASIE